MKFQTTDELMHYVFEEAVLSRVEMANGRVKLAMDNVTILPENTCNRDIRKMRANDFYLTFAEGQLVRLVEEGYKVYDADGNLKQTFEDREMSPEEIETGLNELADLTIYQITKEEDVYSVVVDGEDHSFRMEIKAAHDIAQWDKFLTMDSM